MEVRWLLYIVFIRVLIIYALIILSLRLMGKRQIGQVQPSELVVTILVSNIATMAIEDSNVPLIGGIIPILTLVSFDVLISAMTLRYKKMRRIVSGTPRVIIRDGKIDQKQLKELRFTIDDMMEELRGKDILRRARRGVRDRRNDRLPLGLPQIHRPARHRRDAQSPGPSRRGRAAPSCSSRTGS